jgi:hypothetical protein
MRDHNNPIEASAAFAGKYERRHSKTDWAGVHLGDAFRNNIDFMLRLAAQRSFYRVVKNVQKAIMAHAAIGDGTLPEPLVKPQIAPFYTTYPSILAAHAAIGLTGFLEMKARLSEDFLQQHIRESISVFLSGMEGDETRKWMVSLSSPVIRTVETRIILEELSRLAHGPFIEAYRLFCASQQTLLFASVPEIVDCVVLYGDILPDSDGLTLHPVTRDVLKDVSLCSKTFLEILPGTQGDHFVHVGLGWVKAILLSLRPYLQAKEERDKANNDPSANQGRGAKNDFAGGPVACTVPYILEPKNDILKIKRTVLKDRIRWLPNDFKDEEGIISAADRLAEALDDAAGQNVDYEDMRSDLVEHKMRDTGWQEGPMQGNPIDGSLVSVQLGNLQAKGEQFEQSLSLSDNSAGFEKLMEEASPVSDALRSILYPNVTELPLVERLCTSGPLDPARLFSAFYSDAISRRTRVVRNADKNGAPVLLIACDGSGSLNASQIHMLKILTAAWLRSTAKTRIQILAGLYHSGSVREGLNGSLVEWIYHPKKTPAVSRIDSIRALVDLPGSGTGVQSDALSLAFMLNEAQALAKNCMVYLIVLSDCAWNKSFHGEMSGEEEVRSFFADAYRRRAGRLHTTLVALGVEGKTGFEKVLDRVIAVGSEDLNQPAEVAHKIGAYVASCLKERHGLLSRRAK